MGRGILGQETQQQRVARCNEGPRIRHVAGRDTRTIRQWEAGEKQDRIARGPQELGSHVQRTAEPDKIRQWKAQLHLQRRLIRADQHRERTLQQDQERVRLVQRQGDRLVVARGGKLDMRRIDHIQRKG